MDLPILTRVSGFVLHEYNATRFRWRFRDGGACFEAFYSSDPLEYDGHGAYCPLMWSPTFRMAPWERCLGRTSIECA